jgi:hypothetical protein
MGKKSSRALSNLWKLAAAVATISLLETFLVIVGILPPVLSYSPGNLFFMLLTFALIVYAGTVFAKEGSRKAALNGAILSFTSAMIICLASLVGSVWSNRVVLGVPAPNTESLIIIFALIVLENVALGTIVAGFVAFLTKKLRK